MCTRATVLNSNLWYFAGYKLFQYQTLRYKCYQNLELYFYSTDVFDVSSKIYFNPLKPELNPICYLLALLGAHHFLHVSRIRVKSLTLR